MIRQSPLCIAAFILIGCADSDVPKADGSETSSDPKISEQIKGLSKRAPIDLTQLEGETSAEKFLYLIDAGNAARAGALVGLDGQISALRNSGNAEMAQEVIDARPLFLRALDENLPSYITQLATIYDPEFTDDELKQLIELHSQPVMQKLVNTQTDLMAEAVEYAEAWGVRVAERYQELLLEADSNE